MNHKIALKLKPEDKADQTWVMWAHHPVQKAVVFVHGYMGNAVSTWSQFEYLLPTRPKAKDYDIFFYGYNCHNSNTIAQGRFLCEFLRQLFSPPADRDQWNLPQTRNNPFPLDYKYKEVLLVGHSIGAIVCRRALLMARDLKYDWMNKTRMVLFAPAHNGALISAFIKEIGSPSRCIRWFSPLIDEVAPGSQSITQLKNETASAVNQGANYLKATKVIIAEVELVVSNLQFTGVDPVPAVPYRGTTHFSVCKPNTNFTYPVEQLEEVM